MIVIEPSGRAPAAVRSRIEIHRGEIAVLEGPSGSGESDVLAAAAGRRPGAGLRAAVAGQSLGSLSPRARRRAVRAVRLFYLPAEPALISNLTVLENVLLPVRYLGGRGVAEAAREALETLEGIGLLGAAGRLPARLSPPDRKCVALVRGFLRGPLAALLDDPLGGLEDREAAVKPLLLAAMREGGCAILASARDLARYRDLEPIRVEIEDLPRPERAGPGSPP